MLLTLLILTGIIAVISGECSHAGMVAMKIHKVIFWTWVALFILALVITIFAVGVTAVTTSMI